MQNVLIAGGTGLIGQHLSDLLTQRAYKVCHLSRKENLDATYPAYQWDLEKGTIDENAIEAADYVINLAGAGIADKRWSKKRKQLIIDSRVKSNDLLQKAFLAIKTPKAYIAASAIGFYGDRGTELLKENTAAGKTGFLASSCVEWENAIQQVAKNTNVRTAVIRVGLVLSVKGGVLSKMLPSYQFRLGAYFGSGDAIYSWIHIDDISQIFIKAIENSNMSGVYNGVAPNPVSNREMAYIIAEALDRKGLIAPVPRIALRLGMGEMADAVLTSAKVSSKKIENAGLKFDYPVLLEALKDLVDRKI